MRYHDFDLWIEPSAVGGLSLRSCCDEHGEYRDEATVDLDALRREEDNVLTPDVDPQNLIAVGKRLYGCAFTSAKGEVEWHFAQCRGAYGSGDKGVRVRLRVEDPKVATLPWEFLYSEHLRSFLGVSVQTPVVRYLELPRPIGSLETSLPVRMLVVIPQVADLDTAAERRQLVETLAQLSDTVSLTILEGHVTRQDIADALAANSFHVLHFIGHGDFDGDAAVLLVNGAGEEEDFIDHATFAGMLRNQLTMKLVVLNSCRGAQLSSTKPLVGMAAALVKEGVPAVIAMQYEIEDREAITFARIFYRALFTGDNRGRIEIALSQARNALATEYPKTRALGIPVLFTHAREGVLFELVTGKRVPDRPFSKSALHRDEATLAAHKRNIELLRRPGEADAAPRAAELAGEEKAYAKTARRIRLRYASVIAAFGCALIVFFLSLALGFQRLPARLRVESYAVWLTDLFDSHTLSPSLAIVSLDSISEAAFGPRVPLPAWRGRHAQLVDRLVSQGAKTIVLMFAFKSPTPFDDSLAASIRRAGASGTDVVIGVDSFRDGVPNLVPSLAAAARSGPACLGDKSVHSLKMLPMVVASTSSAKPARIRSLALESVAAYTRSAIDDRFALSSGIQLSNQSQRIRPSEVLISEVDEPRCSSIAKGDTLAEMYIEYSPLAGLRDRGRHKSYVDVLRDTSPGRPFQNMLVLVGQEIAIPDSMYKVRRGFGASENRTSVEIFTDAVNSLLGGSLIRPLGQWGQFAFILVLALAGAAAAIARPAWPFRARLALLLIALGLYLVVAMWLYSASHLLLNTVFHITALLTTFLAVALIRRKWFA
jgi:CHASE2 domain-containing sensor protein